MAREFADRSNNNAARLDFKAYRKDSRLIGLKAVEGVSFTDKTHAARADEAHRNGVRVAHYGFVHPAQDPEEQAADLWAQARPHFKRKDYLVVDLETLDGLSMGHARAWLTAFVKHLRKISGHVPVGYTGQDFLERLGEGCGIRRWWVAAYGPRAPVVSWLRNIWAWQYTDGTVGPGPHELAGVGKGDTSRLNHASWLWVHRP